MCLTVARGLEGAVRGVALDLLPDKAASEAHLRALHLAAGFAVSPRLLGGYFGVYLPCIVRRGTPMGAPAGGAGGGGGGGGGGVPGGAAPTLLHFWLQGAIEDAFELDDEKGIVGCAPLDARVAELRAALTAEGAPA
jgi:hypothetical protein